MSLHRSNPPARQGRAFTLIELLIVVAIIAILAAIAVPNFLEAQVRAKVTKLMADMRTAHTAIEAYTIDHNGPPPGWHYAYNLLGVRDEELWTWGWGWLTTPIAYITTGYGDPFEPPVSKAATTGWLNYTDYFWYGKDGNDAQAKTSARCVEMGYLWCLKSPGPSRLQGNYTGSILSNPYDNYNMGYFYDPTNGTKSRGWILRTNKGPARPGA